MLPSSSASATGKPTSRQRSSKSSGSTTSGRATSRDSVSATGVSKHSRTFSLHPGSHVNLKGADMTKTSWVELCVSDFEQSITWFEHVLGFRVVARDANEYAELSRGETSLQLAPDHAPYWASERPRLLAPGQRGSGVEIILLVEDVEAVYRQAQQARADIVRPLADYSWHMRQFWVRHPDGYLIRPAQRILSVNPAT